jgi:hypothetical protein
MSTKKKRRICFIIRYMLPFACVLCFVWWGKTKQLRSDSAGVEFVTEGDIVTCLNVRGTFPYTSIAPKLAKKSNTDTNGNVTEVYEMEAEISLNTKNTMKLYFERLEGATYTYILKFADKDIIITNGKVVEYK